jgi:hypothetical protein
MAAKSSAKIDENSLRLAQGKILLAVTRTKEYADRIDSEAAEISGRLEQTTSAYYERAIDLIADMAEAGMSGAHEAMGSRPIETPEGATIKVQLKGKKLSKSWLDDKESRAYGGGRRRKFKDGRKPKRGASFGAGRFWLDERKLGPKLALNRGLGTVTVTSKITGGRRVDFKITFRIALKGLPSRYLDLAIRRSLVQGAGGPDRASAILEFSDSHATKSSRPTGVGRGFWPEVRRPTMRPIAQRLGRALKKQLLKIINRR